MRNTIREFYVALAKERYPQAWASLNDRQREQMIVELWRKSATPSRPDNA